MRIPRIYTDQPLSPQAGVTLEGDRAHYLGRVLRIRVGDRLVLFNGDGSDYPAELVQAGKKSMQIQVEARLPAVPESPLQVRLVQAVSRGERMDYTIQKATELGVFKIQPLFSKRTEVKLDGPRLERRMDHWRSVIISACEQGGRATIPELLSPVRIGELEPVPEGGSALVLDTEADRSLSQLEKPGADLSLLVGPEGGLEESELGALEALGYTGIRMGPRILRTETAGPAAIAALQAMFGDW